MFKEIVKRIILRNKKQEASEQTAKEYLAVGYKDRRDLINTFSQYPQDYGTYVPKKVETRIVNGCKVNIYH